MFGVIIKVAAAANVTINTNIPGASPSDSIQGVISNFYSFALIIAGILAFGAVVWGGIKYATGRGNPTAESEGKSWITNALLGLLLLGGAWIVLYTVNPNLVSLTDPSKGLPGLSAVSNSTTTIPGACSDLQAIAKAHNEPYPGPQNSTEINTLIACIHQHVSFSAPQWTYDVDHSTCNYTRGATTCDSACSHAVNSCHYGGKTGSQGALAVDFDVIGTQGQQVVDAASQFCGIPKGGPVPKARCEAASGVIVPCVGGGATHVHISAASCDAN